jgi:uncharacterized protein (TIGR02246 family)
MKSQHYRAAVGGLTAMALALTACQQSAGSGGSGGKADPEATKKAITALEKKWSDQFQAKPADLEALLGNYADDAFFIAPGVKSADGSTEIRQAYANGLADPNFTISFASDKVDVASSGELAYSRGHFTEKYTDPKTQKVMSTSGSFLTVWKKQQDGSWKAQEDFAASDPDATKPVPPAAPATRAKMTSF